MYVYFYGVSQNQDQTVRRLSTAASEEATTNGEPYFLPTRTWLSMKRSKRRVRSISL